METWKRTQNMQVVSLAEGAFVGRLDDFQFDLEDHRVYGWRLKGTGMFARVGGVAGRYLSRLGRDVAFVESEGVVEWSRGKVADAPGRAWASTYRGVPAITRRGRALGAVQDYVLEANASRVTGIILHGNLLLPLDGRVRTGPAAVVVSDEGAVVELPAEAGDEREDWWARLKEALGVRNSAAEE